MVIAVEGEAARRHFGVVEAGENRMHFTFEIDPPLRIGLYRRRS